MDGRSLLSTSSGVSVRPAWLCQPSRNRCGTGGSETVGGPYVPNSVDFIAYILDLVAGGFFVLWLRNCPRTTVGTLLRFLGS